MRKKVILRIFSLIFVTLILFSAFPFTASAADYGLIDTSGVVTDLEKFGIKIEDYQKDPEAEHCRMLKFLEYGYDYYGSTSDYGLYIYLWNPSGKEIDTTSRNNYIQLQTLNSAGTEESGWRKFRLKLCSYSTLQGYEYVFYKFRIEDAKTIFRSVEKGMRQYDISGVEVQFKGENNATDFKVGGVYTYTGYMPYHAAGKVETSSLTCYIRDRVTVELELHPVSWKTKTSDKGAGYQYEVSSVYFAVPNDIIRDYGNKDDPTEGLVEVKGTFEEYKVNGILTPYTDVYNYTSKYVGVGASSSVPFGFSAGYDYSSLLKHYIGGVAYNNDWISLVAHSQYKNVSYYCASLRYDADSFARISSDKLFEELYASGGGNGFYTMKEVDDGRTKGFQYYTVASVDDDGNRIDLNNEIASFASNHGKVVSWLRGEGDLYIENESYESIEAIEVVSNLDFFKDSVLLSDAAISDKFFLQESEVDGLQSFVNKSVLSDKTTYMMRFAVRDYYCSEAYVRADGWGNNYDVDEGNYYFEKTVFHNFDVISLTYENAYGERTVIPVVSSPIDIGGTVTPPADGENSNTEPSPTVTDVVNGCKDLAIGWKLALFLLGVFIISWLLSLFGLSFKDIFRFVGNVITAPFKALRKVTNKHKTFDKSASKKNKSPKVILKIKPEKGLNSGKELKDGEKNKK